MEQRIWSFASELLTPKQINEMRTSLETWHRGNSLQRVPKLLSMQVQQLVFKLTVMPESIGLLQDIGRFSAAAQQTNNLAADLPELLAKERAATIAQLTSILDARQWQVQALIVEPRAPLEACTATSDSV